MFFRWQVSPVHSSADQRKYNLTNPLDPFQYLPTLAIAQKRMLRIMLTKEVNRLLDLFLRIARATKHAAFQDLNSMIILLNLMSPRNRRKFFLTAPDLCLHRFRWGALLQLGSARFRPIRGAEDPFGAPQQEPIQSLLPSSPRSSVYGGHARRAAPFARANHAEKE